jgi:hypothetical protein
VTKRYGLYDPVRPAAEDPYVSVCNQVRFHRALAARQLADLGPDRFRILEYGDFCQDPRGVVSSLARQLGIPCHETRVPKRLEESRSRVLPDDDMRRLERALADQGLS